MLRLQPRRLLVLLLLYCGVQSRVIQKEHIQENMDKLGELEKHLDQIHPVTFPPLSADDEAFLQTYSQQKFDEKEHVPSIVEINGARGAHLIEGDIIPTDDDIAEMEEEIREAGLGNSSERNKRAASDRRAPNWPTDKPISYYVSKEYNQVHQQMFRVALAAFKENTCIEFAENGGDVGIEYYDGGDCASFRGDLRKYENGAHQKISLGLPTKNDPGSCMTIDTIQHETMHALGFGHTQARADRDQYVRIVGKDIKPGSENQFIPLKHTDFDNHTVPYEYNSVMHYPSTGFSKNDTPVLIPWKHEYIASVGGDHGATFNDWKQINFRYKCLDKCPKNKTCMNNGYQHPRNCESCACPIFYTGEKCENEVNPISITSNDEEHIEEYESPQIRELPVFLDFSTYDKQRRVIMAPEGRKILITVNLTKFACKRECTLTAVEIVDEDMALVGKRFCCSNGTAHSFVSQTNVVGYQVYAAPNHVFSSRVTFSLAKMEDETTAGISTDTSTTKSPSQYSTVKPETETTIGEGHSTADQESATTGTVRTVEPQTPEGLGATTETAPEQKTEEPNTEARTEGSSLEQQSKSTLSTVAWRSQLSTTGNIKNTST